MISFFYSKNIIICRKHILSAQSEHKNSQNFALWQDSRTQRLNDIFEMTQEREAPSRWPPFTEPLIIPSADRQLTCPYKALQCHSITRNTVPFWKIMTDSSSYIHLIRPPLFRTLRARPFTIFTSASFMPSATCPEDISFQCVTAGA